MERGLKTTTEIDMMMDLGIDIQGLSECNSPWTRGNKAKYNHIVQTLFDNPRATFSSAPSNALHNRYQHGGTLLSITGPTAGRIKELGSDPWGRSSWATIHGKQDEEIFVASCYRVCQDSPSNAGPLSSYHQQCTLMRTAGIQNPNPRKRFFTDLLKRIEKQRDLGFCPIVMLDANGDWNAG